MISGDAHDGPPHVGGRTAKQPEASPDRVLPRPLLGREPLVDNRRAGVFVDVLKLTTSDHGHAQRPEVARSDEHGRSSRATCIFDRRRPGHLEPARREPPRRRGGGESHRTHAGNPAQIGIELLTKRVTRRGVRIPLLRQTDEGSDEVVHPRAEVGRIEVQKAAGQHARARQQNDGRRHLPGNEPCGHEPSVPAC